MATAPSRAFGAALLFFLAALTHPGGMEGGAFVLGRRLRFPAPLHLTGGLPALLAQARVTLRAPSRVPTAASRIGTAVAATALALSVLASAGRVQGRRRARGGVRRHSLVEDRTVQEIRQLQAQRGRSDAGDATSKDSKEPQSLRRWFGCWQAAPAAADAATEAPAPPEAAVEEAVAILAATAGEQAAAQEAAGQEGCRRWWPLGFRRRRATTAPEEAADEVAEADLGEAALIARLEAVQQQLEQREGSTQPREQAALGEPAAASEQAAPKEPATEETGPQQEEQAALDEHPSAEEQQAVLGEPVAEEAGPGQEQQAALDEAVAAEEPAAPEEPVAKEEQAGPAVPASPQEEQAVPVETAAVGEAVLDEKSAWELLQAQSETMNSVLDMADKLQADNKHLQEELRVAEQLCRALQGKGLGQAQAAKGE